MAADDRVTTGKAGGMLLEAVAAVDIALWDIMGKAVGQPVHHLLGSMGRDRIEAYASSISWASDEVPRPGRSSPRDFA